MKPLSYLFLTFAIATSTLHSEQLVVRSPAGEPFVIDVESGETLTGVVQQLQRYFGPQSEYILDFMSGKQAQRATKSRQQPARNYLAAVTPAEKKEISFIVNTLGMSSLIKIATIQSELKKAGDRVDHVHPLRFLMTIFTDEAMKASMCEMQDRRWVWGEFLDGLKESLSCETARNNMRPEFINDFAGKVGINPALIYPVINSQQWTQLVVILIKNIPRKTDTGRYDM